MRGRVETPGAAILAALAIRGDAMARGEDAALRFEQLGVDYYVLARSAVLAQQRSPVCGNIFHHAIEMFLKAGLSRRLSLEELTRFKHDLRRLWRAFKAEFPGTGLDRHDEIVGRLDRFERLRYPDAVLREGMWMSVEWEPEAWASTGASVPHYHLVVNDVDRLVAKIFEVGDLDPAFFTRGMNDYARDALTRRNPVAGFLVPGVS
jgi:hypothetical protein